MFTSISNNTLGENFMFISGIDCNVPKFFLISETVQIMEEKKNELHLSRGQKLVRYKIILKHVQLCIIVVCLACTCVHLVGHNT